MPSIDDPGAMRALIPHLRAFARTLEPDPGRADALVRDALAAALAAMLADRRPAASAEALRARITARVARATEDASAEPGEA